MVSFPNAKINLGLHVLSKREDGYHNITSCLYPVPWYDVLEIMPSQTFRFEQTGLPMAGEKDQNLCVRAYRLIKEKFGVPPVSMHLHKVIPMGAGLGGGSSNAAFTVKCLNSLFDLKMTREEMIHQSALLGSDCPFFVDNAPALATATGTSLSPIDLDLSHLFIGIIAPRPPVDTARAYGNITPKRPQVSITDILRKPIEAWQGLLGNDFEIPVASRHPQITEALSKIRALRPVYSAMSGSGSAVFGIFNRADADTSCFHLFAPLKIRD